jgi:ADP-dependent NAD(P)H-hydrate dehydratase / NAD(P)H-hydrate epimerase
MKIFQSNQIKEIDNYTIEHEPVSSVELMERAATRLFEWFAKKYERSTHFLVFIGPGNNGGDGLALARLLFENDFKPELFYVHFTDNTSVEWKTNYDRIARYNNLKFNKLVEADQFPIVCSDDVIVDALFGTGLSRPLEGLPAEIVKRINSSDSEVISVDMPSGLFGEDNSSNNGENIIKADRTLTFQMPKLSFMFPENYSYVGKWELISIGLHPVALRRTESPYYFLERNDISVVLKDRNKFDHKGIFGHGLLIAGTYGKFGAAILSAKAALHSGIGNITCHIPRFGVAIIQISLPEAMVEPDQSDMFFSDLTNIDKFDSIGIGPGLGINEESQKALHKLLKIYKGPIVLDADAINILGINKAWLSLLPDKTILTPHIKEFERIAGETKNSFERLNRQIEFSIKYSCIIVLKGAHTSISTPDGRVWFNSTGNPGMATGGSGDVLTGIILSLLAQGYTPENAAVAAVYLHGLAGDIAADKSCYEAVIASDIVDNIGISFNAIRELKNSHKLRDIY